MTTRFCPTCKAEVAESDGFCLLGHPLRLASEAAPLSELRAEVERAFEEARAQVGAVLNGVIGQEAGSSAPTGGSTERSEGLTSAYELPGFPSRGEARTNGSEAPGPPGEAFGNRPPAVPDPEHHAPPPLPPPAVFETLSTQAANEIDPISAFAPSPRMDWGPDHERARFLRKRDEA